MFYNISIPNNSPSYTNPHHILKHTLSTTTDKNFTFYTHPKIKFYLFKNLPKNNSEPIPTDHNNFFDHTTQSINTDFHHKTISILEAINISIKFNHHKNKPNQQKIDLHYTNTLTTTNNIMTFHTIIHKITLTQNM